MPSPTRDPEPLTLSKSERYAALVSLFLLVFACWVWPDLTGLISHHVYDQQIRWRAARNPPSPDVIVVKLKVAVDGDWAETYAKLMVTIAAGRPKAIGLDFIPQTLKVWPGTWPALAQSGYRSRIAIGCWVPTEGGESPELPVEPLYTAFSDQLGYLNIPTEPDGAVRRYYFGNLALGGDRTEAVPSFAARLVGEELPDPDPAGALIDFGRSGPELDADAVFAHQQDLSWLTSHFSSKFVLIGPGVPGDQDLHSTPLGRSTYGVEVHAQALQTLLSGFPLQLAPFWWQLALLMAVALPCAAMTRIRMTHRYLLAGAIAAFLWLLASTALFIFRGYHFPAGPPLVTLAILAIGLQGLWVLGVERSRRALRATFTRYVSHDVVSELLKQPVGPVPKPTEITVMFTDINGFSTACERYDAVAITHMLSAYFDEMSVIIEQNGGTIMRFIGDEFLILFGAPAALQDSEAAAVRTALAMHDCLDALKDKSPKKDAGFFDIKVGIHSGEMVLASIGTRGRSDYNVIGDAANVASRIQSLCKTHGRRLLVSNTIWERIESSTEFQAELLGDCSVKGRTAPVQVYSVSRQPK